MIRIIAGKYGKRQIKQPPSSITRPTMDKVREAVFSSIQFDLEGKIVLDLFSGSGAWSIESVSRYALKAIAVEIDIRAYKIIKENIENLNINNIDVYHTDALKFLQNSKGRKFDFIFFDPPFKEINVTNECLKTIKKNRILGEFGKIILETNAPEKIIIPEGMIIKKKKEYGEVTIMFISQFD